MSKTTTVMEYGVSITQNNNVLQQQHQQVGIPTIDCKLYTRRWAMLALFVLCSMANAVQWIQYSIISNVIMKFYNVSSFQVNLTSIVYMVTYIPLIFPASWILDKKVRENILRSVYYIGAAVASGRGLT